MGCDIHLYVEKRNGERWEHVYKGEEQSVGSYKFRENYYGYSGRNYCLFGILAGVRSRGTYRQIDEPRGLPKNLSPEVKKAADDWDLDGHSYSWFTLKELQDFDWETVDSEESAWLSANCYEEWDKKSRPESYCQDVAGPNIRKLSPEGYEAAKARGEGGDFYIWVTWRTDYADAAGYFYEVTMKRLAELDPNPENVRIVFWFDS